ncbi:hypothetical protein KJ632_04275 [Patescibacteria group bacterium]|nr:hypothetical protein [Patescibacteria group bacterium]
MFEVILILLFLGVDFYVGNLWFSVFSLGLLLILVLPGLYSFVFGAPFLISTKKKVTRIIKFAGDCRGRIVVEMGCGDGRIIRQIARRGVKRAEGYEFSFPTYLLAKFLSFIEGGKARILFKNFWKVDYSEVDILICFLNENSMRRLKVEIWSRMKRGAKLISNEFELPGVSADEEEARVRVYIKK